jgi:hypothetical protein
LWLLQVGFHNDKLVKKTQITRRLNEIMNRLNKTQVQRSVSSQSGDAAAAADSDCCCGCWYALDGHSYRWPVQEERFPDLAAEKAAWEKEQIGKRKSQAAVGCSGALCCVLVVTRKEAWDTVPLAMKSFLSAVWLCARLPVVTCKQVQRLTEKEEKEEQKRQQDMLGVLRMGGLII